MHTDTPELIHYLPIVTTVVSALFLKVLIKAHKDRSSSPHLLWWIAGVFFYGLGTALEGSITLWGNTVFLNKSWYVAGALLGGYPLAQGVVYLLFDKRKANMLAYLTVPLIAAAATLAFLSPVNLDVMELARPSGAILEWSWIRLFTPFINLYAFAFLVGGAVISAVRYRRNQGSPAYVKGNLLIAFGGLLPGVGGGMAKAGYVEALYVGEFVGLLLIWLGYTTIVSVKYPAAQGAVSGAS